MPSANLLPTAAKDMFEAEARWEVNGKHYSKTLEAWLKKHDAQKDQVLNILKTTYGDNMATIWYHRWRIFYMACSELFALSDGKEWPVMHYRFSKL